MTHLFGPAWQRLQRSVYCACLVTAALACAPGFAQRPDETEALAQIEEALGSPVEAADAEKLARAVGRIVGDLPPENLQYSIDIVGAVARKVGPDAASAVAEAARRAVAKTAEAHPDVIEEWWAELIDDSIVMVTAQTDALPQDPGQPPRGPEGTATADIPLGGPWIEPIPSGPLPPEFRTGPQASTAPFGPPPGLPGLTDPNAALAPLGQPGLMDPPDFTLPSIGTESARPEGGTGRDAPPTSLAADDLRLSTDRLALDRGRASPPATDPAPSLPPVSSTEPSSPQSGTRPPSAETLPDPESTAPRPEPAPAETTEGTPGVPTAAAPSRAPAPAASPPAVASGTAEASSPRRPAVPRPAPPVESADGETRTADEPTTQSASPPPSGPAPVAPPEGGPRPSATTAAPSAAPRPSPPPPAVASRTEAPADRTSRGIEEADPAVADQGPGPVAPTIAARPEAGQDAPERPRAQVSPQEPTLHRPGQDRELPRSALADAPPAAPRPAPSAMPQLPASEAGPDRTPRTPAPEPPRPEIGRAEPPGIMARERVGGTDEPVTRPGRDGSVSPPAALPGEPPTPPVAAPGRLPTGPQQPLAALMGRMAPETAGPGRDRPPVAPLETATDRELPADPPYVASRQFAALTAPALNRIGIDTVPIPGTPPETGRIPDPRPDPTDQVFAHVNAGPLWEIGITAVPVPPSRPNADDDGAEDARPAAPPPVPTAGEPAPSPRPAAVRPRAAAAPRGAPSPAPPSEIDLFVTRILGDLQTQNPRRSAREEVITSIQPGMPIDIESKLQSFGGIVELVEFWLQKPIEDATPLEMARAVQATVLMLPPEALGSASSVAGAAAAVVTTPEAALAVTRAAEAGVRVKAARFPGYYEPSQIQQIIIAIGMATGNLGAIQPAAGFVPSATGPFDGQGIEGGS